MEHPNGQEPQHLLESMDRLPDEPGRERMGKSSDDTPESRPAIPPRTNGRKVLRTGTYLHTSCPVCGSDMIHDEWIQFHAVAGDGSEGQLRLSPRFNVFDKHMTVGIEPGDALADLRCPRCQVSLIDTSKRCEACGSRAVKVRIAAVRVEVNLYICTKMGCHWHGVTDEDCDRLVLDQDS